MTQETFEAAVANLENSSKKDIKFLGQVTIEEKLLNAIFEAATGGRGQSIANVREKIRASILAEFGLDKWAKEEIGFRASNAESPFYNRKEEAEKAIFGWLDKFIEDNVPSNATLTWGSPDYKNLCLNLKEKFTAALDIQAEVATPDQPRTAVPQKQEGQGGLKVTPPPVSGPTPVSKTAEQIRKVGEFVKNSDKYVWDGDLLKPKPDSDAANLAALTVKPDGSISASKEVDNKEQLREILKLAFALNPDPEKPLNITNWTPQEKAHINALIAEDNTLKELRVNFGIPKPPVKPEPKPHSDWNNRVSPAPEGKFKHPHDPARKKTESKPPESQTQVKKSTVKTDAHKEKSPEKIIDSPRVARGFK